MSSTGKYVTKSTKVILLGESLQDFLVIHKKRYEYENPNAKPGAEVTETQLVISEVSADTDNGVSYIPSKTLYINETSLRKLYEGLKEVFEPGGGK